MRVCRRYTHKISKRRKHKKRKENKEIKGVTHTIFTMGKTVHNSICLITLITQVSVHTQALNVF